jgi:hypothetical protein
LIQLRLRHPLLAGLAVAGTVIAGAAVPGTAAGAAPAVPSVTPATAGGAATITLISGERVARVGNGFAVLGNGRGGAFVNYRDAAGDQHIIPNTAVPYLGRGLDRSLFNVSALFRAGYTDAAKTPLTLSYAPGTAPTAPAGLALTGTRGTTATGHGTPTTAFGDLLRSRTAAEIKAGRRPGAGTLAPGLTGIDLAGSKPPAETTGRAAADDRPLTIRTNDMEGNPPIGAYVWLMNTDSLTRHLSWQEITSADGTVQKQVPAGNYAASVVFFDFDEQGVYTVSRMVTKNDFVVSADAPTELVIDEREATTKIGANTPRPSIQDGVSAGFGRTDAEGRVANWGIADAYNPTYVNPQPEPEVGSLNYVAQWDGVSADLADKYRYDLAFDFGNIPANQTFTVRSRDLATVRHKLYADPGNTGIGHLLSVSVDPTYAFPLAYHGSQNAAMPGTLTNYLNTGNGGGWQQMTLSPNNSVALYGDTLVVDAGRTYAAEWGHGPLAPNLGQSIGPKVCTMCATGSVLQAELPTYADSSPDHHGGIGYPPWTPPPTETPIVRHYVLYRDGVVVADRTNTQSVTLTDVPQSPGTYRLVFDVDNTASPYFTQSTRTHTDLTFKYDPVIKHRDKLPAGHRCTDQALTGPCQILPVLTLRYDLGTDLTNTSTGPLQSLKLTVGHQSFDGAGSRSRITKATLALSHDGERTWEPVQLTGRNGEYLAVWPNPTGRNAVAPAFKVTAEDADGNTITQTITNPYTLRGTR